MEKGEIIHHIDAGANYYLRLLGDASHMTYRSNPNYDLIQPKGGEQGVSCVFNIRLDHLPEVELEQKVSEIKQLNLHIWWGVGLSERMLDAIWKGQPRPVSLPEPNDDEACMALLPEEKPIYEAPSSVISVKRVQQLEDFRTWAGICNQVLHDGYGVVHPANHYHLCESGKMPCYLGFDENTPASAAAIINNQDSSSLEFVATLQEHRRKGLAKAVCSRAIDDAFGQGDKIITLRASPEGKGLYRGLGFKIYS
jgi:GNAT superfamily N-acetyltransferase